MADVTFIRVVEAGAGWTTVEASDGGVYTFRGTRNWRNNNPGNIEYGKFAKSQGAIGSDGRFAVFPSYAQGQRAREVLQFESPSYKDKTVAAAIKRYAPPFENDVEAYVRAVTKKTGISRDAKMSDLTAQQRRAFLVAQEDHEGFKPGRIVAAKGKAVPQSVVQQFKGKPLPPADIGGVTARQNIRTQLAEQAEMRNRVIPPVPGRRPETVNGKVVKPLPAPAPLAFKAGSVLTGASAAKATPKAPVAGLKLPVVPTVAAKPAVTALGRSVQQTGQEADNARLSGYRSIQEMGPSSKGAKPTGPVLGRPSGVIKTTAPEQQPIPHSVVPASLKAAGYGKGSALTTPKAPVEGLIQLRPGQAPDAALSPGATAKASRLAAGAAAGQRASAAQAAAAKATAAQQAAAANAKAAAQQAAQQRVIQERARQQAAAAARAAALAATRSAPAIGNGGAYTTTEFQQDRFQTTTGATMPSSMNNSRWTTGY